MRHIAAALVLALAMPALAGCATSAAQQAAALPDAAPFDREADAPAQLAAAQARAARDGRMVLAVFGANWCHDSRALAGWLQTPDFAALTAAHFEIVYIDVGMPQTGEGRNLDLAAGLGVADITGTPTMLVLGPDGSLLNTPDDARSWRNAASRSGTQIHATLAAFIAPEG